MSRIPLSFVVPDASLFARGLGQSLKLRHEAGTPPPGHVELLNLMARALGHRNLQSLQALGRASNLPSASRSKCVTLPGPTSVPPVSIKCVSSPAAL